VLLTNNMLTTADGKAGFTLLEIMLAMLVLALVVSMVTLSLSGSIKAIDATRDQGDIYFRAQVALERIREDLTAAVLSPDVAFVSGSRENDNGETALLSFASMAHIVFDPENGRSGMAAIGYTVRPDSQDAQQLLLLRSDVLYLPREEQANNEKEKDLEAFLLTDRLRSVRFAFINRDGAAVERWNTAMVEEGEDQESQLPAVVTCRLEFWLDMEEETSIVFETSVVLPVGLMSAGKDHGGDDAS